ncbi:MAG: alanine:cation symporter family protein [bacterium]|nr:alanine:cation symporter family protein [bacterium]
MNLIQILQQASNWFLGWPLIVYVLSAGIMCTITLSFLQFKYFIHAWRITLFPSATAKEKKGDMTPLQAFVNTLSTNLGNGSLAGMATAVYSGGPGAAIWAVIIGFLLMSIRFAEVYISTLYGARTTKSLLGGPMLYLKGVPGGTVLSYVYGSFLLFFALIIGNAMQANSIRLSIETTWGVDRYIITTALVLLVSYIVLGGAPRIIKASDRIVPIKVAVFFISSFIVLIYHYQSLWAALVLMTKSAFSPIAFAGGVLGFTVQQAMRFGIERSIMATESGLGTAAVLFGFTGSKDPMTSGLMGMLSTFISTIVCLLVATCIVASGVWASGATSTALTIAAFNTVFGSYGGWIVSFLSISFGIGVLVSFGYITRAAWLFLTDGKWAWFSTVLYILIAIFGALVNVDAIWEIGGIANGGLLVINLFGVVYLLPVIKKSLIDNKKI